MTEIAKTLFVEESWGWPASGGPVTVEMSKVMELSWGKDTDIRDAKISVRASQTYQSGASMPVIVNEQRVGNLSWGALDTGERDHTYPVQVRKGTNKFIFRPTTANFVFPGSNQGGIIKQAILTVKFVGKDPTTTAPRIGLGTSFGAFAANLAGTAPWVLALLAIIGIIIMVVVVKVRSGGG